VVKEEPTQKQRNFRKYTARRCMSLHFCEVCRKDIALGELYFDGGYGRRAHVECVENEEVVAVAESERVG
jgi:hypothetical protein